MTTPAHYVYSFSCSERTQDNPRGLRPDYLAEPGPFIDQCVKEVQALGRPFLLVLHQMYGADASYGGVYKCGVATSKEAEARICYWLRQGVPIAPYTGCVHDDGSIVGPSNPATQKFFAGPLRPYLDAGLRTIMFDGFAAQGIAPVTMAQACSLFGVQVWGEAMPELVVKAGAPNALDPFTTAKVPFVAKSENLLWRDPQGLWRPPLGSNLHCWLDSWQWGPAVQRLGASYDPGIDGLLKFASERATHGWKIGCLQGSDERIVSMCR